MKDYCEMCGEEIPKWRFLKGGLCVVCEEEKERQADLMREENGNWIVELVKRKMLRIE